MGYVNTFLGVQYWRKLADGIQMKDQTDADQVAIIWVATKRNNWDPCDFLCLVILWLTT